MTTIRLEFPAGRYHGTPYGRHVNEGVTEWPPSPYRLLRALYDVWKRKCPGLPEADVQAALSALAEAPPRFYLPPAMAAHTRSYLSANALDPQQKNLVYDAFLSFDKQAACYLAWPELTLSVDQRRTLLGLLENLNYLGRSESWIRATLDAETPTGQLCEVLSTANYSGEAVPVGCVVPSSSYSGKAPWLQALTASTSEVAKNRASSPPLLRAVKYLRPEGSILTDPVTRPVRKKLNTDAVLLTLDSTVLPLATAALEVAEQIRVRLMGAHKKRIGSAERVSPLFSGKTEEGTKRLDHGHLYILPLANARGRIDRVLLVSRLGPWTREELDAASGVRRLWQADGRPDVYCAVAWQGEHGKPSELWKRVTIVHSATPFVCPRHWRKGRDLTEFVTDEVRRECENHRLPAPVQVTLERHIRGGLFECIEYRRSRKGDPVRPGYALVLKFHEAVMAPFAIGYGAHFGLGQFKAAD